MSTSERKAHALKRDLSDIKNSMSEINTLAAMGRTQGDMKLSNTTMNQLTEKFVKIINYLCAYFKHLLLHVDYDHRSKI